jgi:hypothetical protein
MKILPPLLLLIKYDVIVVYKRLDIYKVPRIYKNYTFGFLNWYSGGGGVQLGPLGAAATNRPIVPTPGDYDDGEIGGMIGR